MTDLDELIARLEAASEGSRELDARLQAWRYGEKFEGLATPEVNSHDPLSVCWVAADNGRRYTCWHNLAFTRSIDAALTLLPEGARVRELGQWDDNGKPSGWHCTIFKWERRYGGWTETPYVHGDDHPMRAAPTPALALCIAALRARSSKP